MPTHSPASTARPNSTQWQRSLPVASLALLRSTRPSRCCPLNCAADHATNPFDRRYDTAEPLSNVNPKTTGVIDDPSSDETGDSEHAGDQTEHASRQRFHDTTENTPDRGQYMRK